MNEIIWGMGVVVVGITIHHVLRMKNECIGDLINKIIPRSGKYKTVYHDPKDPYWGNQKIPAPPDDIGFKSRRDITSDHHNYK